MAAPSEVPWPLLTKALYEGLVTPRETHCHPTYPLRWAVAWYPDWNQRLSNDDPTVKDVAFGKAAARIAASQKLAEHANGRRRAWVEPLVREGRARVLGLTALTPCVIHLSSPGPLELGLALHHVYGFPVLPATSLKGLARAASREDRGNKIYGEQDSGGAVTVLDGLPLKFSVSKDVMTVHQPGWYGQGRGNRMPCDRDDPTPIPFLSIDAGAEFEVVLIARDRDASHCLDAVEEDLRRGVDERGLGAKTAAGYGWFQIDRVDGRRPPPQLGDPYQERLCALQQLKANASNIGPSMDFWLTLKDDEQRREFGRLVVEKMTPKWVKDQAKTKEKWKQLWEFYKQLQPGQ